MVLRGWGCRRHFCRLRPPKCRRFCETFLGVVFVSSRLLTLPLPPSREGAPPVGPPHESGAAAGGQTLVSVLPALRVRQGLIGGMSVVRGLQAGLDSIAAPVGPTQAPVKHVSLIERETGGHSPTPLNRATQRWTIVSAPTFDYDLRSDETTR